jgi:hypothetical protein
MATTLEPAWRFQHSLECHAPREFAWSYWTDLANWNDPPASFELDGPFAAGSRLTTRLPTQTLHSVIREVRPGREAILDMQLPDAIFSFHWTFETLSEEQTRITQRLALAGANAESFVPQADMLKKTAPEGMARLATAIESSYHSK